MSSVQGVVIDIESSGLDVESYPIQIGWAALDLSTSGSFLIRPADGWIYWDERSEAVHGLDRKDLDAGLSVSQACQKLLIAVVGSQLYCDAPPYDQFWLDRLFAAGGWTERQLHLAHINTRIPDEHNDAFMDELEARARSHDALNDARLIAAVAMRPKYYG
ncbi:hypothetical protein [Zhongshania borealis]|uniref:Exonuclease domain-containing protein n=1 Tax=Zhongshania borealis TaxID=889488 RepID=A0ABP7W6K0_9GAMM